MSESLHFDDVLVAVDNYHNDFLILRCADAVALRRIGTALHARQFRFVDEVIVTAAEVLLKLNGRFSPAMITQLTMVELTAEKTRRLFHLPVHFAPGEDWETVLAQAGIEQDRVITQLCAQTYEVAMLGFLPGFAYLEGLPEHLQVPRKTVPAKYVPAGAVAIGGKYLGIYALPSPGGWHVIGKTPLRLLEVPDLPPVPFLPGDQFRLTAISEATYNALAKQSLSLVDYNDTYHAGT